MPNPTLTKPDGKCAPQSRREHATQRTRTARRTADPRREDSSLRVHGGKHEEISATRGLERDKLRLRHGLERLVVPVLRSLRQETLNPTRCHAALQSAMQERNLWRARNAVVPRAWALAIVRCLELRHEHLSRAASPTEGTFEPKEPIIRAVGAPLAVDHTRIGLSKVPGVT